MPNREQEKQILQQLIDSFVLEPKRPFEPGTDTCPISGAIVAYCEAAAYYVEWVGPHLILYRALDDDRVIGAGIYPKGNAP